MRKPIILSWGVGLQSTCLLEMSLSGDFELPKLDYAIFSDTGFEHQHTHQIYDFYAPRALKSGIQVIKISGQDIFNDNFRHVTLPLFVMGTDRQIKRKCTRDYKIRPIHRRIRNLLGVNPRGRLHADLVDLWLGITTDEIERATDSRVAYITHHFPLLDLRFTRKNCEEYLRTKGLPVPKKSSCRFCPYQQGREWAEKNSLELSLIVDLQDHINKNGLVKIGGQSKEMSFLPFHNILQADFSKQKIGLEECEGGFCQC